MVFFPSFLTLFLPPLPFLHKIAWKCMTYLLMPLQWFSDILIQHFKKTVIKSYSVSVHQAPFHCKSKEYSSYIWNHTMTHRNLNKFRIIYHVKSLLASTPSWMAHYVIWKALCYQETSKHSIETFYDHRKSLKW